MNASPAEQSQVTGPPRWYALAIDDAELTMAASFSHLLTRALEIVPSTAVLMEGLELVPELPPEMRASPGKRAAERGCSTAIAPYDCTIR